MTKEKERARGKGGAKREKEWVGKKEEKKGVGRRRERGKKVKGRKTEIRMGETGGGWNMKKETGKGSNSPPPTSRPRLVLWEGPSTTSPTLIIQNAYTADCSHEPRAEAGWSWRSQTTAEFVRASRTAPQRSGPTSLVSFDRRSSLWGTRSGESL